MANSTLSLPLRRSFNGCYGVGFTGSRDLPLSANAAVNDVLYQVLWDVVIEEPYEWTTGGCRGLDAFVARWARRRGLTVHTVMPPDRSQADPFWRERCHAFEEIPFLKPNDKTGYERRNQRIVDLSTRLIAFPLYPEIDERSRRSGTWQTIRFGQKTGIMDDADIHVLSEIARRS